MEIYNKNNSKTVQILAALCIVLALGAGIFAYVAWLQNQQAETAENKVIELEKKVNSSTPTPANSPTATVSPSTSSTPSPVSKASPSATLTKTLALTDLNLNFEYPTSWGNATLESETTSTGVSKFVSFPNQVVLGYVSQDFSAPRSGRFYENLQVRDNVGRIEDCSTYRIIIGDSGITDCKDVYVNNLPVGIVISANFEPGMIEGPYTIGYYFTGNATYPLVGMEKGSNSAELVREFEAIIRSLAQ